MLTIVHERCSAAEPSFDGSTHENLPTSLIGTAGEAAGCPPSEDLRGEMRGVSFAHHCTICTAPVMRRAPR